MFQTCECLNEVLVLINYCRNTCDGLVCDKQTNTQTSKRSKCNILKTKEVRGLHVTGLHAPQMLPRCAPDAFQMFPRCVLDASQTSQMPPRCMPGSQMSASGFPDACQMFPRCFPGAYDQLCMMYDIALKHRFCLNARIGSFARMPG